MSGEWYAPSKPVAIAPVVVDEAARKAGTIRNVGFSISVMVAGVAAFAWGLRTRAGLSRGPLPEFSGEASLFLVLAGLVAIVLGAGYLVLGSTVTNAVLVGRTLAKTPMSAIGVACVELFLFFGLVVSDAVLDSGHALPASLGPLVTLVHSVSAFVLLSGTALFLVALGTLARVWSFRTGTKVPRKLSTWWLLSATVLAVLPWVYVALR